jgi:hypothetical protein
VLAKRKGYQARAPHCCDTRVSYEGLLYPRPLLPVSHAGGCAQR